MFQPETSTALHGRPPSIEEIVPQYPAAGSGQLVAVRGQSLFKARQTTVLVRQDGRDQEAFAFLSPSTAEQVYVRLPKSLHPGTAELTVRTLDDGLVSWPVRIEVRQKPAAPIPLAVCDITRRGCPAISAVRPGQHIGVKAHGIDTTGCSAVFRQDPLEAQVASVRSRSSAAMGMVAEFEVPEYLWPGKAIVQLRVTVNRMQSDLSPGLLLRIGQ